MIRCIVYSPSKAAAERKLKEISSENGSRVIRAINSSRFITDTEDWEWVDPESERARGIRADKAFVDVRCTLRSFHCNIMPGFRGEESDLMYFE